MWWCGAWEVGSLGSDRVDFIVESHWFGVTSSGGIAGKGALDVAGRWPGYRL